MHLSARRAPGKTRQMENLPVSLWHFFQGQDEHQNNWELILSELFRCKAVFSFLSVCHWCPTITSSNRKNKVYFHTIVVCYHEWEYMSS